MGNFKRGFILGGLLGAGLVFLNATKKGREMKEKILDATADIFNQVKKEFNKTDLSKITKNKYVSMVNDKVEEYITKNPWAKDFSHIITKLVKTQWVNFKKNCCETKGKK